MSANCPGFRPHSARATRCRRCFRDYSEHRPDQLGSVSDVSGIGRSNVNKGNSTSVASAANDRKDEKSVEAEATITLPRRRRIDNGDSKEETKTSESVVESPKPSSTESAFRTRTRRPLSVVEDTVSVETIKPKVEVLSKISEKPPAISSPGTISERRRRPASYHSEDSEELLKSAMDRRKRMDRSRLSLDGNESDSSTTSSNSRAKRVQIIATKEVEKPGSPDLGDRSQETTSPDVEFILRVKKTAASMRDNDQDSIAATETTEATETTLTYPDNMVEDLQNAVANLKKELEESQLKCVKLEADKSKLEKEKTDIINKRKVTAKDKEALEKTASELLKLRTKINELETSKLDLNDENKVLKLEVKELQSELDKREAPEKINKTMSEMRNKLQKTETLVEELMEENEEIKKEMKDMEEELEELHDNFREDQANEYLDLKKELETTGKNCRVLQFKLRKTERRCEQLEVEKTQLDDKVKDLQAIGNIDADKTKMKELETEVSVAKEVSLKMHSELESMKEMLQKHEHDSERLRKQLMSLPAGERNSQVPSALELPSLTKDDVSGKNYETLVRDLYDTMERETDLREQMRYAEDEIKTMRRKLSSLEQENETVVMQLKKMATSRSKTGPSKTEDDELSPEELKLQFELCEQEMCVLRKKVDELEHENEGLNQEVKYLQDKLVNQPLANIELPELPPMEKTGPNVYFEQKMKLLEYEARELRRKVVEKERENERLQTEVEVHRRKASKVIVRSRSLDSEFQVDLKRQLHLVEQEASILRQKTVDLENENDKLGNENKRFQLRLSRKPAPGPAELMQLENLELKEKVQEFNRKMNTLKEELQKAAGGQMISATVIQEYKPRKEVSGDQENQLVATLKKTIKIKDEEMVSLQTKVTQLEVDNTRVNREYKKLKDTLNYKKRPNRPVRETATRMELKDIIKDLEDEISDLQVTVRAREMIQEDLREESSRSKTQLDLTAKDFKQREEKLNSELNNLKIQAEKLRSDLNSERQKASSFEQQVKRLAEDQGTDMGVVDKMQELSTAKDGLEIRVKELEANLKKEQTKSQEIQDKLALTMSLKEELTLGSKILESRKAEAEKEAKKLKNSLENTEDQIKSLKRKLEESEQDADTLRSELNGLKNDVQSERSRVKQHDNRQTEVAVGWLKERDELKKLLADLRTKTESLQKQMDSQQGKWAEKEANLREEFLKVKEKAIKEAKLSLEADVKRAEDEEKALKIRVAELSDKLEKAEGTGKEAQDKLRQVNNQHRKDKDEWQTLENDLESKLRSELKKIQKLEREHDQEKKQKEQDLLSLKDKIFQMERDQRKTQSKIDDLEHEHAEKVKEMDRELEQERQEYDELTSKYEVLEEEFLKVKSRVVQEKEVLQGNFSTIKREYDQASSELRSLRDTFTTKQDTWFKEKMSMGDTIKELHSKVEKLSVAENEKLSLQDTINEKESLIESYRKEEKHLKDEREKLRRRIEELSKKVTDLERLERASRTLNISGRQDAAREAQDLRVRLDHNETTHKGELSTMRVEYDGKIKLLTQEMSMMSVQITDLIREREDLLVKVQESEDTVEQIKNSSLKRDRMRKNDEIEAARRRTEDLQRQLNKVLEQFEAAQLQSKSLKVQLETEKNKWEIQVSDLQSKINQYEEIKLMESSRGSTRAYAKTRLELAWDKERQEQQKLIQETQAIVNDLRDKIVTLETLRDKEKQEARRQAADLRDLMDLEEQNLKRKMGETQGELYELKQTLQKLNSKNEQMRREKDRYEQEREQWRVRLIDSEDVQIKVSDLMEEVKKMANLVSPAVPEADLSKTANGSVPNALPADTQKPKATPRRASKANEELRVALEKIKKRTEELHQISTNVNDNDTLHSMSFRRAISATDLNTRTRSRGSSSDPSQRWMNPQRITNYPLAPPSMILRPPPRQKSLYRKSLSLDQHLHADMGGKIWDSGDESLNTTPYGSQLSLRARARGAFFNTGGGYESDSSVGDISLDSRASTLPRGIAGLSVTSRPLQSRTGSRESSIVSSADESTVSAPVTKHKKTLREKLKLSKKRQPSVEESPTGETVAQVGLTSVALGLGGQAVKPEKEEKDRSIRSRISKALKKPLSRGSSLDRAGTDRDSGMKSPHEDMEAVKAALQKGEDKPKGEKSKKGILGRLSGSSKAKSPTVEEPTTPPLRVDDTPTAGASMRSAMIRQRSTDYRY